MVDFLCELYYTSWAQLFRSSLEFLGGFAIMLEFQLVHIGSSYAILYLLPPCSVQLQVQL